MAFKMSPIGKKKCPYSPMQKKGLINPPNDAEQKAKDAGFNSFDEYFKDRYGEKSAEKIAQGPYPEGRSFQAGGSGDFVTSSGGATAEVGGRRGTSRESISGMSGYRS